MNFLVPAAFVFAAAIPVVIVFYLLKRKRTVRLVSSTLLWQKFLAETQANALSAVAPQLAAPAATALVDLRDSRAGAAVLRR
jgi:hypothetical protein